MKARELIYISFLLKKEKKEASLRKLLIKQKLIVQYLNFCLILTNN